MVNVRQPRDVAQILLSVLFLAIMIVACLWIVQPFILGFAWAGTVVIATWPVLLRLQKIMFGRRSLAVLVMTLLLVMVFIIPIALLVNSIVDGSGPLIKAISSGDMTLPDLAWLNTIPVIGAKLYAGWHNLLDMGGTAIMAKVRPYIGTTTTWFVGQNSKVGDVVRYLGDYGINVTIYDPWARPDDVRREYSLEVLSGRHQRLYGQRLCKPEAAL